jgi:hypothetical protein
VEPQPVDLAGAPEDIAATAREILGSHVSEHGRVALIQIHEDPNLVDDAEVELLLELTRREVAPQHPSRLTSLFAFASLEDALAFRGSHRGEADAIHAVEGSQDAFRGDARLIGLARTPLVTGVYARWYWEGRPNAERPPLWEVLLDLPVTVGERVA